MLAQGLVQIPQCASPKDLVAIGGVYTTNRLGRGIELFAKTTKTHVSELAFLGIGGLQALVSNGN